MLGRDVVKLITPGTLIEPLDNEANFLLCLSTGPGSTVGLAWIDISTGEFQVHYRKKVGVHLKFFITASLRYHRLKWIALMKTWSEFALQRYNATTIPFCLTTLFEVTD